MATANLRFRRLDVVELRHGDRPRGQMYRATLTCGHAVYDRHTPEIASQVMFGIPQVCHYCQETRNV
jgi:hypothetical protein